MPSNKKVKTVYVCKQCGHQAPRWAGQCPECGEWNTLVEQIRETRRSTGTLNVNGGFRARPQPLRDVNMDSYARYRIPLEEFNRVLGGGIVPGSLMLIGGDPGIGAATLLLEVAAMMAAAVGPVLYVAGEESAQQISSVAYELGLNAEDPHTRAE